MAHAAAVSSFPAGFQSGVDAYLTNVAAASTHFTNVYSVATQYWDGSSMSPSLVTYGSSFGGSVMDTDPVPSSGCTDQAMPPDSPCLTDVQMATEIDRVVASEGWPRGLGPIYFLVTPPGFGSCFDSDPSNGCYADGIDPNGYCGYHADFTVNSVETIYSIIPFDDLNGCRTGTSQSTPDHPNGNSSDDAANIISHEQNEAITDPEGAAPGWYSNSTGEEIGDLCALNYTPQTGSPASNQTINGTPYELQEEWSNDDSVHCAQSEGSQPAASSNLPANTLNYHGGPVLHTNTTYAIYWQPGPPPSATPSVSAGPYFPTQPVTFSATSNYAGATLNWDFGDGSTATGTSVTHAYRAAGNYTVSVTASFDQATGAATTQALSVIDAPPTARFVASTLAAQTGQGVALDARPSNDVDGSPLGFSWSFGDGQTATGVVIVTHSYATPGQKTVALTVTDQAGLSSSATQIVTVTPSKVLGAVLAGHHQTRKSALAHGLGVDVTCTDACDVNGRVLFQVPVKRKGHHARSKTVDLGHAISSRTSAGVVHLTIRLGNAAKRLLTHSHSPLVTVVTSASHVGFGPLETNSTVVRLSG